MTNKIYFFNVDRKECSKGVYNTLSDSSRSVLASPSNGAPFQCDRGVMSKNEPRWFRFTDGAGNSLAMKPSYTERCTTLSGGWMVGSLPKDKNAPVTRKVRI